MYRSLYRILGSIATTRGFIGNDPAYLQGICVRHACNYLGSREIGRKVGVLVDKAIDAEGYDRIADAQKADTDQPQGRIGRRQEFVAADAARDDGATGYRSADGYGTISPDIWRRMLIDYEALGDSFKYAGRFTSHEVNIIDTKLDHYIRAKADQRKSIPHLMVDRFRFDSFASEKITRVLHNTYVRYIDTMYMYFVVTPPEATVERGWERGQVRGRYKAVEDFLGHCIEAYAGMPKLLFKWTSNKTPIYFFRISRQQRAQGQLPRTDRARHPG